jgi:hypothetical protein
MVKRSMMASAGAIVLFAAAACAQQSAGLPAFGSPHDGAFVAPAFSVSGTYKGTIVEQEGTQSRSGTVVITIQQSGRKISGSFDVSFSGKTDDLTISGMVKSQTKSRARISFEISDPKGRYASATATVGRKRLKGKATVPSTDSKPPVSIIFKTKRTK